MKFNKEKFLLAWVPIKLVCYFFLYQVICIAVLQGIFTAFHLGGTHANTYVSALGLVISGFLIIAHLYFFGYASFKTEKGSYISIKTIIYCCCQTSMRTCFTASVGIRLASSPSL